MPLYYEGVSLDEMVGRLRDCYLQDTGWLKSAETKEAVGTSGEPVPWITYPAMAFLDSLSLSAKSVLEFGSGNSTRWWRQRAERVVSVEHDIEWAATTSAICRPANTPLSASVIEPYLTAIETKIDTSPFNGGRSDRDYAAYLSVLLEEPRYSFDIIVIDGMARNTAAMIAADVVRPTGLVIMDNSDRPDYVTGCDALREKNFSRIDFWGLGPINPYGWCTSVFIRSLEALRN